MRVSQILSNKADQAVVTIKPEATVSDAVAILSEKRIGAVIVADEGGTPVGIVSERDVVRELGRRGPESLNDTVENLMTRKLIFCAPDESPEDILLKMTEGRFRHMPVLQDGAMIGIVSIGDVVKARLSELKMERDVLQDMVMGR